MMASENKKWKHQLLASSEFIFVVVLLVVVVVVVVVVANGVPRNFVRGGATNSVEDRGQRERVSGGGSPLVRGPGGSCNLVQEISYHIVNFYEFLVL
jgi:hypothetical protein